jgi:hypothetical protein
MNQLVCSILLGFAFGCFFPLQVLARYARSGLSATIPHVKSLSDTASPMRRRRRKGSAGAFLRGGRAQKRPTCALLGIGRAQKGSTVTSHIGGGAQKVSIWIFLRSGGAPKP